MAIELFAKEAKIQVQHIPYRGSAPAVTDLVGKRIDFMLSGKNEKHADSLVIIELKQWSTVKKTDKDAIVAVRFARLGAC